ncbi:MAG: MarC family protein [Spirochaetales bacterium]|nr:MarC family protein [Spirochaetales bacterium]
MTIYTAAITLLLIMDPFGNIPLFLSILKKFDPAKRKRIILRESLFAFVVLIFFLFFGQYILKGLHITQPALSISGGIILFLIAIRMIFPGKGGFGGAEGSDNPEDMEGDTLEDPILVPMAVPMQAGPSAMAYVILSSSQYPDQIPLLLLALLIASVVSTTILLLSDNLRRLLGNQVLRALERLMGMILTTMAIQMLLTGVSEYLK